MRWLDGITYSVDMNLSELSEIAEDGGTWQTKVNEVAKNQIGLNDWTTKTMEE